MELRFPSMKRTILPCWRTLWQTLDSLLSWETEDVEEQGDLKIDEAIDAEVTENGFVNGENSLFNGTKSESENLSKEKSNRGTEDAKESSSESTDEVKE